MLLLFWLSAFFIVYVYVGYLALLVVWARFFPKPRLAPEISPEGPPLISIVIAARNEAARLPDRLRNLLALEYPEDRRQIIVVSDGSTDGTADALAPFLDRVQLVTLPASGKAVALNAGVARATGDILIFADARQTFAADAATALVAPFADPAVGGVSGELVLGCEPGAGRRQSGERRALCEDVDPVCRDKRQRLDRRMARASAIADGVRCYWGYEKHLRLLESTVGSMLGATGAVYALRRSLWQPLPHGTILDDVLAPMRAVLAGARVVFEPRAQAYDHTPPDAGTEWRRKIRTLAGNVQILWAEPRLLIPFVNPVWLQYASHKIGRLLVPYALLGLFVSSLALSGDHLFYRLAFIAQCAFYLESAYGGWLAQRDPKSSLQPHTVPQRTARIAYTFVMMNASAVAGLGAALAGRKVWR